MGQDSASLRFDPSASALGADLDEKSLFAEIVANRIKNTCAMANGEASDLDEKSLFAEIVANKNTCAMADGEASDLDEKSLFAEIVANKNTCAMADGEASDLDEKSIYAEIVANRIKNTCAMADGEASDLDESSGRVPSPETVVSQSRIPLTSHFLQDRECQGAVASEGARLPTSYLLLSPYR